MPNLGQASGDAEALIESIRDWTAGFAVPLRAIVIDTLARAIGGGDENTAKDMSILVDNAGKIAEAFHYLVVIVHHAGKTAERGSRGSNALDGAADTMWAVEKGEGQNKASIFAMKDGKDGIEWTFRLNPYEIETGRPQQAPQHTCTVEILSEPAPAQQSATERNTPPLTPSAKILFGIINDAMLDAGEVPEGDLNVPSRMKALKP